MPVPEKRVYENKQGSFITGIDVISKVSGRCTLCRVVLSLLNKICKFCKTLSVCGSCLLALVLHYIQFPLSVNRK